MVQQNILVIKSGTVENFLIEMGAIAAIRQRHSHDKVTLLTSEPLVEMAQECGYFDEIFLDDQPRLFNVFGLLHLRAVLNAAQFSCVYDLQQDHRSRLYSKLLKPQPQMSVIGAGCISVDRLHWLERDLSLYALKSPYVLIFPAGVGEKNQAQWPVESFRALLSKLVLQGHRPVIVGLKQDKPFNDRVLRGLQGVVDLTGRMIGLADIPSLARGASAVIGHDTAFTNIAGVAGCPVIFLGKLKDVSVQSVWVTLQGILSERIIHSDSRSYSQHADG